MRYCFSIPSKCPWAIVIHEPKTEVGAYVERPFISVTHMYTQVIGSPKMGGRLYGYVRLFKTPWSESSLSPLPSPHLVGLQFYSLVLLLLQCIYGFKFLPQPVNLLFSGIT